MSVNTCCTPAAWLIVLLLTWLPAGCSGGGGSAAGPGPAIAAGTTGFWATDFSSSAPKVYKVNASKAGEGDHICVYLEQGAAVPEDRIQAIIREFDNTIYPAATAAFGSEPNPGVDSDSKVYILLLDIKDGFNGTSKPSYIAGYFDPGNEYASDADPYSNEKEMLYMDIYPAGAGTKRFLVTLAHEFQHMIHWEQKDHKHDVSDDAWLNEGMSEIAPVYCGYGANYARVLTFQRYPSDSLTAWDSTVKDYGVVYMWAQYMKDRFEGMEPNIFRRMLDNNRTGIDAVNEALGQVGPSLTFAGTFRDWTTANYSGNTVAWPEHSEWSYRSVDMRPGTYGGITTPGLFPESKQDPASPLAPLGMWSSDYYSYTPGSDGTLTWTSANGSDTAVLIDPDAFTRTELDSGASYTITGRSFLIVSNPAGVNADTGASVVRSSLYEQPADSVTMHKGTPEGAGKSPRTMLEEAAMDPDVRERATLAGEYEAVCIHRYFDQKRKALRRKGARPFFNRGRFQ